MGLHVAPVVSTLYLYDGDDGYAERDPYAAAATLVWSGPTTVYIGALRGVMTRAHYREIADWLRAQGVTRATYERRGEMIEVTE